MAMITGAFTRFISRDYEKVFFDEFARQPEEYKTFAKMDTIQGAYKKEFRAMGLSKATELAQGAAINFEDFVQGAEKEFNPKKFGLGVQLTEEMREDDQTGVMRNQLLSELGKAAAYTRNIEWFDLLNSGFVSTNRVGIDSLPLFEDTHKSMDGATTIDNEGTSASLSKTSLIAALNYFEKMKNERSIPIIMRPKWVIIPPELKWVAKELELSEYDPTTANNAVNSVRNEGLQYVVVHFLTSTTAWYVLADKDNHDLRFMNRRPFKLESYMDFNTGNELHKTTGRFVCDFLHFRGAYGNAGA